MNESCQVFQSKGHRSTDSIVDKIPISKRERRKRKEEVKGLIRIKHQKCFANNFGFIYRVLRFIRFSIDEGIDPFRWLMGNELRKKKSRISSDENDSQLF